MTFTTEIADDSATRSTRPGGLKPFFVRVLLLCLSTTAAIGIYALLVGDYNETGVCVLVSTLLVGLFCMLSLADLTVLGTRFRAVGAAGIAVTSAALALGLGLIWWPGDGAWDDNWVLVARIFLVAAVVSFALAHAALLLSIDLAGSHALAGLRSATLTTMTVVAVMLCAPVVELELADTDGFWRLVGALAILDALGTVTLPVLARFETRSAR
jgi:hypothetical protein